MTAIEEMAGMDVLCSDKTGTLTLNKLTVDKNLIEVWRWSCQLLWPWLKLLPEKTLIDSPDIHLSGFCKRSRCRYCCSNGSSSIKNWESRCHRCCYSGNVGWPEGGLSSKPLSRFGNFNVLNRLWVLLFLLFFYWKARAGIQEVHFLPFNPTDKRTALTYIDQDGKMHRVSKGAPEQVNCLTVVCYAIAALIIFLISVSTSYSSDPKPCTQQVTHRA